MDGVIFEFSPIYGAADIAIGLLFAAIGLFGILLDPDTQRGRLLRYFEPRTALLLFRGTGIFFFAAGMVLLIQRLAFWLIGG